MEKDGATAVAAETEVLPGGGFLTAPVPAAGIFTREQFDEDALAFQEVMREFVENEVHSRMEALETKEMVKDDEGNEVPLAMHLLRKMGELDLVGVGLPEEYGGLDQNAATCSLLAETMSGAASFAATVGAHSGIGTLPILLFGNEEQKQKYLPKLATGELVSCYALTEPGYGSDALKGRTKAVRSEDGSHFVLNGEKIYITNGGWADLAVVFARVDDEYSALIVDLHSDGVERGAEEKKCGLKGSSTTSLTFTDVKVPVENLLGEPGEAAKIALNILNIGRRKLGFGCLGTAKYVVDKALAFGIERKQFGQAIVTFGMQKGRVARMVADVFALDSLCYRLAGAIDALNAEIPEGDPARQKKEVEAVRKYALEASIAKIQGSETLHGLAVAGVRLMGGYGFCEEYQLERVLRDNIVDMIFEGTNDINRLVLNDFLVRNIYGAAIGFREFVEQIEQELRAGDEAPEDPEGFSPSLAPLAKRCMAAKRAFAYALNAALIHSGKNFRVDQQLMLSIANSVMAIYRMDSTLARANMMLREAPKKSRGVVEIAGFVTLQGCGSVRRDSADMIDSMVSAGQRTRRMAELRRLASHMEAPFDVYSCRTAIADVAVEAGKYPY